jgi:GAF domain-containing protein
LQSGQAVINREELLVNVSGQSRWLLTSKLPLRDNEGRITGIVGIGRDITERKHAESQREAALEALAQERNLLRTLIDNLPDYIYVKDTEGRFVLGNVALAHSFGKETPDQVYGKSDFDNLPQLPPELQALQAKGMRSFVNIPVFVEGRPIGMLNLGADRVGAFPAEQVAIARQVADQLALAIQQARLREQVQRHTAELEQRVAERTAELAETAARLQAANEQLKELDQLKSQFVSNVSHELRTPLTNIKAYLHLLEHGKPRNMRST